LHVDRYQMQQYQNFDKRCLNGAKAKKYKISKPRSCLPTQGPQGYAGGH
jgi:hypothetical protein